MTGAKVGGDDSGSEGVREKQLFKVLRIDVGRQGLVL